MKRPIDGFVEEIDDSDFDFGKHPAIQKAKGFERSSVMHDVNVTRQLADISNVGTGTLAERLELERHMRSLIAEGTHGFKYIESYLISVGYQHDEILRSFRNLTGLDPNELMDPASYLQSPPTIPGLTAAWGKSKEASYDYFFISPWNTGWALFGQKGDLQRDVVETFATRKEAYGGIKKKVADLYSYDRIITKEMAKDFKPADPVDPIDMTNAIHLSAAVEDAMQLCQTQCFDRETRKKIFAGLLLDSKITNNEYDFLHRWAEQIEGYGIEVKADDEGAAIADAPEKKKDTGIADTMLDSEDEVKDVPFEEEEKEVTPQDFFDSDKDPAPEKSISENMKRIMEYIEEKNEELGDFQLFFRKLKYHNKEVSQQVEKSLQIPTQDMEEFFSANAVVSVLLDIKDSTLSDGVNKKPAMIVFLIINNEVIFDDTFKGKDDRYYSLTQEGVNKYFFREREQSKGLGGI
jgi:hypothetical protein